MEKIENIGGHYTKALRLWKEKFLANFDCKIRPALKREHKGMSEDEIDVFRRKWEVRFKRTPIAMDELLTLLGSTTLHTARRVS